MIDRGERYYAVSHRDPPPPRTPRPMLPAYYFGPPGRMITPPRGVSRVRVMPYVNHGRWVVECPAPGCGGAQVAHLDDPRFFCHACLNEHVDGKWVRIDWPAELAEIEQVLMERPERQHRNWHRHEPVELLRAENEHHGVR